MIIKLGVLLMKLSQLPAAILLAPLVVVLTALISSVEILAIFLEADQQICLIFGFSIDRFKGKIT